jgi:polysaccharide export outer membrane protein
MKCNFIKIFFFLLFIQLLTSCSTEKNILFSSKDANTKATSPVFEVEKGSETLPNKLQTIKAGDELILKNLQNDGLVSGTGSISSSTSASAGSSSPSGYIVQSDSTAVLPVIGKVKLGGLSRSQAELEINALYQKTLLKNPLITLSINNLYVTLLGEFSQQGNFPLKKEQTNLVEIIGEAGGLKPTANPHRIKIIRGNPSNPQILIVDFTDINFMKDKRMYLQQNDIIYVEPIKSAQNQEKLAKVSTIVSVGLTLINTIFLIYNFSKK